MRRKRRRKYIIFLLLGIFCIMGIGFAIFNQRLAITETSSFDSNWNVYISNVEVAEVIGDATGSAEVTARDTASLITVLSSPGDKVSYKVTVKNDGNIDAVLDVIDLSTSNKKSVILYSYEDIEADEELLSQTQKEFFIIVEYDVTKTGTAAEEEKQNTLTLDLDFVQKGNEMPLPQYYPNRNIYDVVAEKAVPDNSSSQFVTNSKGIDFSQSAGEVNGKGVYTLASTASNSYPVNYYRGLVEDNNVIFANHCWKIVRTTETGGTKLFYNGKPANGVCDNTGEASQIGTKIKYNNTDKYESGAYGYHETHGWDSTTVAKLTKGTIFSNDVSFKNGKYILNDDRYLKDDNMGSNINSIIKTHHYTCLTTNKNDCSNTIYYVYMVRGTTMFCIKLKNGETIEELLEEKSYGSQDITSSTVKAYIDDWYSNNLINFESYLEDTVWCNDRSVKVVGGWNKNGEVLDSTEYKMNFSGYSRIAEQKKPSLECQNYNDRFTVSSNNGNGKLTHPIALLTLDEASLAGYVWGELSDNNYLNNGMIWWTMTPTLVSANYIYLGVVYSILDNVHSGYTTGTAGSVRPSVSLKYGVKIIGGNGTEAEPFIVG